MTNLSFIEKNVWEIPSRLPDILVNAMVEYCDGLQYQDATMGDNGGNHTNHKIRNTDVSWIAWDEWIPGIIHNMMISANKAYFNYDLDYFETRIQSTYYNGEHRQHYNWHCDSSAFMLKDKPHERKLSCSLILSDHDEYEGGELQFSFHKFFKRVKPPKGTAIIFPSWIPHRVRPVTSGTRKSLVAWMQGPAFR